MTARASYAEAAVFVAAVGRPRRRRLRERKPGEPVGVSPIWVTTRTSTGRSLVRGKRIGRLMEFADVEAVAEWSVSAAGYVVPTDALADVLAAAQHLRSPIRFRTLDEDGSLSPWRREVTSLDSHGITSLPEPEEAGLW